MYLNASVGCIREPEHVRLSVTSPIVLNRKPLGSLTSEEEADLRGGETGEHERPRMEGTTAMKAGVSGLSLADTGRS